MSFRRVVVLGGGVGNARFLLGLRGYARTLSDPPEVTAVINTGDDMWLAGLRITPDLDTVMYALAGVNDSTRGWGRLGDTERVSHELTEWGVGWPWFTLGDLDLGAHITRTALLREGLPLSSVVQRMTARWPLGVRMLPATDHEVETYVATERGELHFQEWWTRYRASLTPTGFVSRGIESATPAPGVLEAIAAADAVILAPSNPIVSLAPVLALPGLREAVLATAAPVVGVSPIIGGAVVRGMADQCLTAMGLETSALAVARYLGARGTGGLLDGWLVDDADSDAVASLQGDGIRVKSVPLWFRDAETSVAIASAACALAMATVSAV